MNNAFNNQMYRWHSYGCTKLNIWFWSTYPSKIGQTTMLFILNFILNVILNWISILHFGSSTLCNLKLYVATCQSNDLYNVIFKTSCTAYHCVCRCSCVSISVFVCLSVHVGYHLVKKWPGRKTRNIFLTLLGLF